ncbi:RmlC-like cupin domain-containing protein [Xylariaceae sp. FL0804]|nr:RmlC-like cupin domain-containing protein [Xylariaceae sp. FL0804]
MKSAQLAVLSALACLAPSAHAAPLNEWRKRQVVEIPEKRGIDNAAIPNTAPNPVGASGSVYGSSGLLGDAGDGAPSSTTSTTSDPEEQVGAYKLVPGQTSDPDLGLYLDFEDAANPQPLRAGNGATDPGPHNDAIQRQNSDLLARPGTDKGDVPNAKWPMGLSTARSGTGGDNPGWARQQNVDELPVATAMAGVDMRLAPNAYRELHWHQSAEWAYIFTGSVRISSVNQNGETFVDDLQAGDLWFFPAGVPHSIQASPEGTEFLLVFNMGTFSEDDTDLVSEMFLRNPVEVLAKNFQTDVSTFNAIPQDQRYIFKGTPYGGQSLDEARASVDGPAGRVPQDQSFSYHLSAQEPLRVPGGTVKIVDPTTFPIADNFAAAVFELEPGAMREIHWHLTSDEWNFFLSGEGRVTVFSAPDAARTFDFAAGDVGYVPVADSHYVENTGNTTVRYIEILQAPRYADVSAAQWLGLTPSQVVRETLNVGQDFVDTLPRTKRYIVPGNPDLTTTNFTVDAYPNAKPNQTASAGK